MLVKICGMRRQQDLDLAAECGVNYCGFIFHEKSPRYIDAHEVARLESHGMTRVGVFVDHNAEEIMDIVSIAKLDMVQLHGKQSVEDAKKIGVEKIIRVLWPKKYAPKQGLINAIDFYKDSCAYFLIDAGVSGGGSGDRVDVEQIENVNFIRPWFLAGGLNVGNVAEVVKKINPYGLDINSGIEDAPSCKNEQSMRAIMSIIRG